MEKRRSKPIRAVGICVVSFILGALFYSHGLEFLEEKLGFGGTGTVSVDTVKTIIKPASELVTGKYYYTNVVSDEKSLTIFGKKLPGTTDKYVFTYDGTISAGYDISKAVVDVDNENKTIIISLPRMQILSSEVDEDSFKLEYENNSIFNEGDLERNAETRAKCDKKMRAKAKKDDRFIQMTRDNARTVLESFLTASGDTKKYEVKIIFHEEV